MPNFTIKLYFFVAISLFSFFACERKPAIPYGAEIDKPAPNFELQDTKGITWKLSELKGKVVFLNFWAPWCSPCREEVPSMTALNKSLAGEPFQMLTVLYNDTPTAAEKFFSELKVSLPILIDSGAKTAKAYRITAIPETFIIDRDGILRKKLIGGRNWDSPLAVEIIKEYLQ